MVNAKSESSTTIKKNLHQLKLVLVLAVTCVVMDRVHSRSADYLLIEARKQPNTSIVLFTKPAMSVIHCTYACSERKGKSLYYIDATRTCHCNHDLDKSKEVDGEDLITYGVLKNIGQRCSSHADCTAESSTCYRSVCLCGSAHDFIDHKFHIKAMHYNPGSNSCVSSCKRYGSTFQKYPGIGIYSWSTPTKAASIEECLKICLQSQRDCYYVSYRVYVTVTHTATYCSHSNRNKLDLHFLSNSSSFARDCAKDCW